MFIEKGLVCVYYDCLDGGLFIIVVEMVFVGKIGVSINFDSFVGNDIVVLFNEELGGVI